ncbi:sensor histidine kinase [Kribbella sp. NPDC048915]|uniref:sensor histidine kinase n=1 Tax=Kribbella sp. NPDC048915 TaxID=3155148 RepID=UPI003401CCDA
MQSANGWTRGRWAWIAAAALLVLTAMDLLQHYDLPTAAVPALAIARALALGGAWWRPQWALAASLGTAALTATLTTPAGPSEPWPWSTTSAFGHSFVLAIAGARGLGRRELAGWWVATQVLGLAATALSPDRASWTNLITMAALSAAAALIGDLIRSRRDATRRLREQETITQTERAERERLQERARIARELHDVVAHHLSVVVVRADSAPHRLQHVNDDVRAEFAGIAEEARSSLTEMRRVLRLLREPTDQRQELDPQPGLEQLTELVESTRRAGADVRLTNEVPQGLDPAVELTAYRVVQEGLSNAVRHAPHATVHVTVRRCAQELEVIVQNDKPPLPVTTAPGTGHGLTGMRERVALLDGTVSTGPTPEGGYLVHALLPMEEAT